MDTQKEALQRIISTLANKKEELQHFLDSIDGSLSGLEEESCKAMVELEAELDQLRSSLEERGAQLCEMIKEEEQRKKAELKRQRSEGACALRSCDDLLAFSNQTLTVSDEEEFLTAARLIKERVTMAPAFRLTTRPCVSESMSQYAVDFSAEREGLHKLHFLPVPRAPEIDVSGCSVQDNAVHVAWRSAAEADADGCWPIQRYELEYRKTTHGSALVGGACWERICDITETQIIISGLKFDSPFVVVRVRATNKAAAGEFSEPVALETRGNQEVCGGCHYWELRPSSDWKSFSVGVAYRGSLGRYEQLGKSSASWCLFASQWLQTALAAKHNNRARSLEWPLPQRIGIYCDYDNGDLLFVDVQRLCLLHAFKAKFQQPLVPAFTLWCGTIAVTSGLQVPSFMSSLLSTNRSLSSLSHDQPSVESDVRE